MAPHSTAVGVAKGQEGAGPPGRVRDQGFGGEGVQLRAVASTQHHLQGEAEEESSP